MNEATLGAMDGDWEKSANVWRELIEQDSENFVVGAFHYWIPVVSDQDALGCEQPKRGIAEPRKAQRGMFSNCLSCVILTLCRQLP